MRYITVSEKLYLKMTHLSIYTVEITGNETHLKSH